MTRKLASLTPYVLPVIGCILIAIAAFLVAPALGFLVSGGGAFLLDWHVEAEGRKR